jgi:hypothetical protein
MIYYFCIGLFSIVGMMAGTVANSPIFGGCALVAAGLLSIACALESTLRTRIDGHKCGKAVVGGTGQLFLTSPASQRPSFFPYIYASITYGLGIILGVRVGSQYISSITPIFFWVLFVSINILIYSVQKRAISCCTNNKNPPSCDNKS